MNCTKKKRPCLRCGKKFSTTPEVRICSQCKNPNSFLGNRDKKNSYAGWHEASGGFDYYKDGRK